MSMLVVVALYTMNAKSQGSAIDVELANPGKDPVTLTTHVKAGIDHFDALTVVLTGKGGATRRLTFSEAREKSAPIEETIAGGKSVTESVDLQFWATRAPNGGEPIAPGTYAAEVIWETGVCHGRCEKLTAKTTVVIAEPKEEACSDPWNTTPRRGTAPPKVELLGRQLGKQSTVLEVGIHNADSVAHCVAAYVNAGEVQSDWMTVVLDGKRSLAFDDTRTKAVQVLVSLPPGATWWHQWDLAAWAKRKRNGGTALPHGHVAVTLGYDATKERDALSWQTTSVIGVELP